MNIVFLSKKHFLKTESDIFLIDLLKSQGEVTVLRVEEFSSWSLFRAIQKLKPDCIIFFAMQPSFFHHILRFPSVKKVFVPMYDGFRAFSKRKEWLFHLFGLKALCFSKPTEEYLKTVGLKTLKARYFPPSKNISRIVKKNPPYTFFLWQRCPEIDIERLKACVGEEQIEKIIYKSDVELSTDPKIEQIKGWLPKEELDQIVAKADFFIAPRLQEGIGMSFLDALSLEVPVIAWNDHTMTEYIVPGKNGFFFQSKELFSPEELSRPLQELNDYYRECWQEDKKKIISFIFS